MVANTDRRAVWHALKSYIEKPKNIFVLEGLRQIGKTTLVQRAVRDRPHVFLTLTDETAEIQALREVGTFSEFSRFLAQFYGFHPQGKQILVIDEAQRSKTLYRFVPQMARDWQGTPIILLGSVMGTFFHRLDNAAQITPAGRVVRHVLRPFSFFEFLDLVGYSNLRDRIAALDWGDSLPTPFHREAMGLFASYLSSGGFPEAILLRDAIDDLYRYYHTLLTFIYQDADRYLEDTIGQSRRHYSQLLETLLRAIGQHSGDMTKRSSLISTDSPAYRHEVPALLDAVATWHLIFQLKTELKSPSAQMGKASKKYLADVGLLNHLLRHGRPITWSTSEPDPFVSRLLESAVAQELVVQLQDISKLNTWRSSQTQARELDFVAYFSGTAVGVEVKMGERPSRHALSQLREFVDHHRAKRAVVVYTGPGDREPLNDCDVCFIPPYAVGNLERWIR